MPRRKFTENLNYLQFFSFEVLDYFDSICTDENYEWIVKYFDVLMKEENESAKKFNKHHIRPVFTFKDDNHKNRKETKSLADNFKKNLIKLSINNHIKAHNYLRLIFIDNEDARKAILFLCNKRNIEYLTEDEIDEIAKIIEECSKENKTDEERKQYYKEWKTKNKEKFNDYYKSYNKNYYKKNREKILNESKEYRKTHEEKIKIYKEEHKEEIKNTHDEWVKTHQEEIKIYNENHKEENSMKQKEYYKNNKEKIIKKSKEYRDSHKKECSERAKKYYENNKDKISKRKKIYRNEHKEELAKKNKEYRETHKEELKQYSKEYHEKNKEKILEKTEKYNNLSCYDPKQNNFCTMNALNHRKHRNKELYKDVIPSQCVIKES